MINLTIFAPPEDLAHESPRGFAFVDQVFTEAGYGRTAAKSKRSENTLFRTLGYLARRYPGRLRYRYVNPWSPQGLLYALRYRQRTFPAVVIEGRGRKQELIHSELDQLSECVEKFLSLPEGN